MAKPTHAHLTRSIDTTHPNERQEQTKQKMQYYMTAKLTEIGVNPKSAIYEWSVEKDDKTENWTYSAYWGASKEQRLRQSQPLTNIDLINCAQTNAVRGIEATSLLCGYGQDFQKFNTALKQAGKHVRIEIDSLQDLAKSDQFFS